MMKNKYYLAFIVVLIDFLWAAKIILIENNCPVNEHYNEYKVCEATCRDLNPGESCVDITNKGCQCIIGFVRNDTGTCIHPNDCSKSLKDVNSSDNSTQDVGNIVMNNEADEKNLTKNECSNNIVLNDNLGKHKINVVLTNGTDTINIQEDNCPENEHFNKHKACESTCQVLVQSDVCTEAAVEACECNDGYVRNEQGTCIEPSYCDEFSEYSFLRDESMQNDDNAILDDNHDILDGFLSLHRNLIDRFKNESNNANTYNSVANSYRVYRSLISEAFRQKKTLENSN